MDNEKDNENPKWYVNMVARFNEIAQNLGVEGPIADEMRQFMFTIAKEQFKVGNKSGIRFAMSDEGRKYFAAKA
jgi:hypothetical protein